MLGYGAPQLARGLGSLLGALGGAGESASGGGAALAVASGGSLGGGATASVGGAVLGEAAAGGALVGGALVGGGGYVVRSAGVPPEQPDEPNVKLPEEAKRHDHHTVPHEIRKRLPAKLRDDPDLKRTVPVDAGKHLKELHRKKGMSSKETGIYGGKYNYMFHAAIEAAGGYLGISKEQVLAIRDALMRGFGR